MPICNCGATIPNEGLCYNCMNTWLNAVGGEPISRPVTQTNNNQLNQQIEQLKNDVELWKGLWVKSDREKDALAAQNTQLQTAKATAERERDTAKSNLTQEQTAHQQTKKDKAAAEQERDKLKREHASCLTTIQNLTKEKQTLQGQLDELLTGISGEEEAVDQRVMMRTTAQVDSQMEAKVQQTDLPPGGNK